MARQTLRTPLCDVLGIEYPIILAGMARTSSGPLAAAVSNAGGLGVTDSSESGAGVTHTLDNVGRYNFIVYQFSQNVVVDKAFLGYVSGDSDLTAWVGTSSTTITNLSDSLLSGMARPSTMLL